MLINISNKLLCCMALADDLVLITGKDPYGNTVGKLKRVL